jgi:hypothetical protein
VTNQRSEKGHKKGRENVPFWVMDGFAEISATLGMNGGDDETRTRDLCRNSSKNFKAIRTGATAFIPTSISIATMELGLERVTRLDGLDSLPSSLNKAARQRELAEPKSGRELSGRNGLIQ